MTDKTCHVGIVHHFFVFIIFVFLSGFCDSSAAEAVRKVCQSAKCIEIAEKITKYMDPSISPCDDFYKFVCNKYHENKDEVPKTRMFRKITSLLAGSSSLQQNKPYEKAFKLYETCMAQNVTNQYEIEVIRRVIQRIGGWPLVEGDKWHEKKWEEIVASLSQSGYYWGIFFKSIFRIIPGDSYIEIFETNFDEIQQIDNVTLVATQLGANSSSIAEIKETIKNVSDHFRNFKSKRMQWEKLTIGDMMVRWPSIDWMTYFTSYYANLPDVTINTNTNVTLFTDQVDNVVDFIARTSKIQIMNYVIPRIVLELQPYLPQIVIRDYFGVHRQTVFTSSDLQRYCTAVTVYSLPEMVISILRVNYIDQNMMNKCLSVSESLKDKMTELINQAHLDDATLQKHQETLSKLRFGVWGTDKRVEESVDLYKDLVLNEQDFSETLWNVVSFHHNFYVKRTWRRGIPEPTPPADRHTVIVEFKKPNGKYEPFLNKITLNLVSLTSSSFQDELPKYFAYGMLGYEIAHEIGHSVSMNEINSYENKLASLDHAQRILMSTKLNCFTLHYIFNNEELTMEMMNTHSLVEDVADHIGMKLAHLVYKDWLDANGPDPQLPNLNYTSMQMFWISRAHDWCDDIPESEWLSRSDIKHHSTSRYRVNMPLSNNLAFSEAFECQPGSRMNPVGKCSYW